MHARDGSQCNWGKPQPWAAKSFGTLWQFCQSPLCGMSREVVLICGHAAGAHWYAVDRWAVAAEQPVPQVTA